MLKQIVVVIFFIVGIVSTVSSSSYLSPVDLDKIPNSDILIITDETGNQLHYFSLSTNKITRSIQLHDKPTGTVISKDGSIFYVTVGFANSQLLFIEAESGKVLKTVEIGHGLNSPVLSKNEKKVYVNSRFENALIVINAKTGKVERSILVSREPISSDITPDGKFLYVSNHLPAGRADLDYVASKLSVIDLDKEKKIKDIKLVNGAEGMRDVKVSPDGKYVYTTHLMARYQIPTNQIERGWINTNALSVVSVADQKLLHTVLLDDVNLGFANPWAIDISDNGEQLAVSSAGNNEVMLIDLKALNNKIEEIRINKETKEVHLDMHNDLAFIAAFRQRIQLNSIGLRSIYMQNDQLFTAGYFSESLDIVDLNTLKNETVPLCPPHIISQERQGEIYFNDASLCFQKWQSCASCHSNDGRVDGLNWDLLNDGIGNPKNAKSLLYSHVTAPVMSLGVRADAETAVRAGLKYIQFAQRPEEDAKALDAYLKSLIPIPSPHLNKGKLSKSALRGAKVFEKAGCLHCHSGDYFTNQKSYNLGTGKFQDQGKLFDTPMLVEVWRTAPYMHDGRAASIEEAIEWHYTNNKYKLDINDKELYDLVEYVKSL